MGFDAADQPRCCEQAVCGAVRLRGVPGDSQPQADAAQLGGLRAPNCLVLILSSLNQCAPALSLLIIHMGHAAGFLGVAAGATLAVRAMGVRSPEEFRDAVRAAAQPTADALRSRATGVKLAIQVRCVGRGLLAQAGDCARCATDADM